MDGIIIINKEKGYTSHDAVYKIKKMFNTKVGHTGTLDPNATGVLPILLGKGTKLSKYLIEHDKEYEVLLQLGTKTTTADEEGEEVEKKCVPEQYLQFKNIEKILKSFIGESQQVPPMYSAIKVNGKKLYEYARKGQQVEIKPRNIEIYDIELSSLQGNGILKLDILEGTAKDFGELESDLLEINTKITIDNIAPTGELIENKISDGKVNANIKLSEQIRKFEGWKFSKDGLNMEKEFTNSGSAWKIWTK